MSQEHEQIKICEYLFRHLEKSLTPEQESELKQSLQNNPEGIELYMGVARLYAQFSLPNKLNLRPKEVDQDVSAVYMKLLEELSDEEKYAESVTIPDETHIGQIEEKVSLSSPEKRDFSRLSLFSVIFSAAAALFLIAFIRFVPPYSGYEVATLTDCINAQWKDKEMPVTDGMRLRADKSVFELQRGLIELEFDTQARVVIEAPAEFQILAEDRIGINYGKIYARVPSEAIGFSIYTQNSKIIDMGTEFGIEVDYFGETQLHVIKGSTILIAGESSNKASIGVSCGQAKKVSAINSVIADIPCQSRLFVRDFDSNKKIIWRNEPALDLADMVRGGNGLGTGNSQARLDPLKGFTTDWHTGIVAVGNRYRPITDHPFIDGIFIPDGDASQVVSSRGDVFLDCPDTSGFYDVDLFANPGKGLLKTELREGTIRFNEKEYTEESGNPCIIMHANRGLTFDLDAIRKSHSRDINQFRSQIGIADLKEDCPCNADFYVLVDGQIRYSLQQYNEKGILNEVSVEIKDTDRFLTLITTDGGDLDYPEGGCYKRSISCDWCVFTEPILVLE